MTGAFTRVSAPAIQRRSIRRLLRDRRSRPPSCWQRPRVAMRWVFHKPRSPPLCWQGAGKRVFQIDGGAAPPSPPRPGTQRVGGGPAPPPAERFFLPCGLSGGGPSGSRAIPPGRVCGGLAGRGRSRGAQGLTGKGIRNQTPRRVSDRMAGGAFALAADPSHLAAHARHRGRLHHRVGSAGRCR